MLGGQMISMRTCGGILTKQRKCHIFLPSLIDACLCDDHWAMCIWLSQIKVERERKFLML
jgi:hypothetical protein